MMIAAMKKMLISMSVVCLLNTAKYANGYSLGELF